jgi:hypothetical protein
MPTTCISIVLTYTTYLLSTACLPADCLRPKSLYISLLPIPASLSTACLLFHRACFPVDCLPPFGLPASLSTACLLVSPILFGPDCLPASPSCLLPYILPASVTSAACLPIDCLSQCMPNARLPVECMPPFIPYTFCPRLPASLSTAFLPLYRSCLPVDCFLPFDSLPPYRLPACLNQCRPPASLLTACLLVFLYFLSTTACLAVDCLPASLSSLPRCRLPASVPFLPPCPLPVSMMTACLYVNCLSASPSCLLPCIQPASVPSVACLPVDCLPASPSCLLPCIQPGSVPSAASLPIDCLSQ